MRTGEKPAMLSRARISSGNFLKLDVPLIERLIHLRESIFQTSLYIQIRFNLRNFPFQNITEVKSPYTFLEVVVCRKIGTRFCLLARHFTSVSDFSARRR